MRYLMLIFAMSTIGCTDKEPSAKQNNAAAPVMTRAQTHRETTGQDSLALDFSQNGAADKAKVRFIGEEKVNDTLTESVYHIEFYRKRKVIYSYPVRILPSDERFWIVSAGTGSALPDDNQFVSFEYGGEACGIPFTQFLFNVLPNRIQPVGKWEGVPDAHYSTGDFVGSLQNNGKENVIPAVYCDIRDTVVANDAMVKRVFRDSVNYVRCNGTWQKVWITPKGKFFREQLINE